MLSRALIRHARRPVTRALSGLSAGESAVASGLTSKNAAPTAGSPRQQAMGLGIAGSAFGSSAGMLLWGSGRGIHTGPAEDAAQVAQSAIDLTSLGVGLPISSVTEAVAEAAQPLTEAAAVAECVSDAYFPVKGAVYLIDMVHTVGAVDWWLSIVGTTVLLRFILLPAVISQMQNTARMSLMRPEMEQVVARMKAVQTSGSGDSATVAAYQRDLGLLWKKHNCHPLKSVGAIFLQFPVLISMFVGIQRMATIPSMKEGGALWFTDLTVADPNYLLPITSGLLFLATVELGAVDGMQGQPNVGRMKNIMRAAAIGMVPLTAYLPQGVFIYWITSNALSAAQAVVLKIPGVKGMLGIPEVPVPKAPEAPGPVGPPTVSFKNKPSKKKGRRKA